MGSRSDWETMQARRRDPRGARRAATRRASCPPTARPTCCSSTPPSAAGRGLQVIIAGAGGAAHLPGMTAAKTHLPVLGVPVESKALKGMDSLLSIVADAGRRPGRHPRDRPGRRGQRRAAGRRASSRCTTTRSASACCSFRATQTETSSRTPIPPTGTLVRSASSAAASSAACSRSPASRSAIRFTVLDPAPDSPAGAGRASRSSAPTTTAARSRGSPTGADVVTYEFENVPVAAAARARRAGAGAPAAGGPRGHAGPADGEAHAAATSASAPRRSPPSDDEASLAAARGAIGGGRRRAEDPAAGLRRQGPGRAPSRRAAGAVWDDLGAPGGSYRPRGGSSRSGASCRSWPPATSRAGRVHYPLAENVHRDGILRTQPRARRRGRRPRGRGRAASRDLVLHRLEYVGVLAIELFETADGLLAQRDRAPRAQQRALDDRGRRDQPVREPPARRHRDAARPHRPDRVQRHGEPDRHGAGSSPPSRPSRAPISTCTARSLGRGASWDM